MLQQIVDDEVAHGLPRLFRRTADMRCQHHIIHGEQGRGNIRLIRKHIKPRRPQSALFKGGDQRRFIHHGPARHIHQHTVRTQRVDHIAVDDAVRL